MMRDLRFLAGRTIEQNILRAIQKRYAVVPVANIQTDGTHGPRLEGDGQHASLPDSQFFGRDRYGWLEVKAKTNPNLYRLFKRYEHGIDKDKYDQYLDVQFKTGMPVYVVICDLSDGSIRMSDLNTLKTSGKPRIGTWPDGKQSINFDVGALATVGKFSIFNDDLTAMKIDFNWQRLSSFLTQLELGLTEAA